MTNRIAGHRFSHSTTRFSFEVAECRQSAIRPKAFVACPVAIQSAPTLQQELYRQAYELARLAIESKRQRRESAYQWN